MSMSMSVAALKNVLLPTDGLPTKPIFTPMGLVIVAWLLKVFA